MSDGFNIHSGQHFDYEEKRQQVSDLEIMIGDFERLANELDQQIKIEQQASGISDVTHFAYPTFARSAITRRDNLRSSIAELQKRLEKARDEMADGLEQVKMSGLADGFAAQRHVRVLPRKKTSRLFGIVNGGR